MALAPGPAPYSAKELIEGYGVAVGQVRRCSCCNKFNLVYIEYPGGVHVLLCRRCDTGLGRA